MHEMDLIPGDYRQDLKLQRSVRLFLLACLAVLCLTGLTKALLTYLTWHESQQTVQLKRQQQIWTQNQIRSETLRQQKGIAQQQLNALEALRGGDRVPVFLQAVDQAFSEGIWFDSVHFMRGHGTATPANLPGSAHVGVLVLPNGAEDKTAFEINQNIEVVGHALNHSLLAEFMNKLGAQPGVADLRLIDTSTRNYTTMQVVDFKLTLQMKKMAGST